MKAAFPYEKEGRAAFVLPRSRFAKRGAMSYNKHCIERAAMKKGGGEMNRKLYDAALCGGYAVFIAVTILSFRWLTDGMNMDGLLAFLLAQSVGILLLYHLRRIACYLEARTFSTHEYGAFLLINAMVLVVNALVMYTAFILISTHRYAVLPKRLVLVVINFGLLVTELLRTSCYKQMLLLPSSHRSMT